MRAYCTPIYLCLSTMFQHPEPNHHRYAPPDHRLLETSSLGINRDTPLILRQPRHLREEAEPRHAQCNIYRPCPCPYPCTLCVKKGCRSASAGVSRLSGFSVKHRSSKSVKWLSSLLSASSMPADAASRRVRRSRVGLTLARVRTVVCDHGASVVSRARTHPM